MLCISDAAAVAAGWSHSFFGVIVDLCFKFKTSDKRKRTRPLDARKFVTAKMASLRRINFFVLAATAACATVRALWLLNFVEPWTSGFSAAFFLALHVARAVGDSDLAFYVLQAGGPRRALSEADAVDSEIVAEREIVLNVFNRVFSSDCRHDVDRVL